MIVELLFVKIVFLQLWYAYICFKSYNDQQRWICVLLHFQLTKHRFDPRPFWYTVTIFQQNRTALCYNIMTYY